jgi:hypothetical protein
MQFLTKALIESDIEAQRAEIVGKLGEKDWWY